MDLSTSHTCKRCRRRLSQLSASLTWLSPQIFLRSLPWPPKHTGCPGRIRGRPVISYPRDSSGSFTTNRCRPKNSWRGNFTWTNLVACRGSGPCMSISHAPSERCIFSRLLRLRMGSYILIGGIVGGASFFSWSYSRPSAVSCAWRSTGWVSSRLIHCCQLVHLLPGDSEERCRRLSSRSMGELCRLQDCNVVFPSIPDAV